VGRTTCRNRRTSRSCPAESRDPSDIDNWTGYDIPRYDIAAGYDSARYDIAAGYDSARYDTAAGYDSAIDDRRPGCPKLTVKRQDLSRGRALFSNDRW
jgi:hypothetical protein